MKSKRLHKYFLILKKTFLVETKLNLTNMTILFFFLEICSLIMLLKSSILHFHTFVLGKLSNLKSGETLDQVQVGGGVVKNSKKSQVSVGKVQNYGGGGVFWKF